MPPQIDGHLKAEQLGDVQTKCPLIVIEQTENKTTAETKIAHENVICYFCVAVKWHLSSNIITNWTK